MLTKVRIAGFRGMSKSFMLTDETTIVGGNARGKTTILDAIRWCLTGSDGQGVSNNNIFNNRRTEDKKETVSVECVFTEDDVDFTFARTATLSDGSVSYAYKYGTVEVPYKRFMYFLEGYLAPLPLLKFALNVRLWDNMTESELRKALMLVFNEKDLICEDTYKEVVALSKTTGLDEVKKQLRKKIREWDRTLDMIALEVDIKERSIPDAVDSVVLERMLQDKERALAEEESKGDSISTAAAMRMRERAQAVVDAETSYANAESAYRVGNISRIGDMESLLVKARLAVRARQSTRDDITALKERMDGMNSVLQNLKDEYDKVSSETFDGRCPTCGHMYEEGIRQSAANDYTEAKKERLTRIVTSAKVLRERMERTKREIEEKETQYAAQSETADKIGGLEKKLDKAKRMAEIKFEDTKEGIRLRERIDEAREINKEWEVSEVSPVSVLRAEVLELRQKIDGAERIKEQREQMYNELTEIKKRRAAAVKDKTNDERLLSLAISYEVAVCQGLEDCINGIIKGDDIHVSLYTVDANGEAKPQCKVFSSGVTDTLNNALRNTVGIRIAESLMAKFAHPCPILIDNGEAFDSDNMPHSDYQLVMTKVDNEGGDLKFVNKYRD